MTYELHKSITDADADRYPAAVRIVTESQNASTSHLQRKMELGYNGAERLIKRMETEGVVSAPDNVGKRTVLVKPLSDTAKLLADIDEILAAEIYIPAVERVATYAKSRLSDDAGLTNRELETIRLAQYWLAHGGFKEANDVLRNCLLAHKSEPVKCDPLPTLHDFKRLTGTSAKAGEPTPACTHPRMKHTDHTSFCPDCRQQWVANGVEPQPTETTLAAEKEALAKWLFENFPHDPNAKATDPYWPRKAANLLSSDIIREAKPLPTREQNLLKALQLALGYLTKLEPGDSRAVSDEFVAMAAVEVGIENDEVMQTIEQALLTPAQEP